MAFVFIYLQAREHINLHGACWLFMFAINHKSPNTRTLFFHEECVSCIHSCPRNSFGTQTTQPKNSKKHLLFFKLQVQPQFKKTKPQCLQAQNLVDLRNGFISDAEEVKFFAIFKTMTAASWIFGHGSGFTYDLHRPNKETLFGHANHISHH